MFKASKTCEFLHDQETPGNQTAEAIQKSLANLNKHLESIDQKIAVLDVQAKGLYSETKPDNFPPDDYIEKLEGRVKKLEEQNNWIQERFLDMTCQIITNEYANDEYMDEQMNDMKNEIVEFVNKLFTSFITKEGQNGTYPPDSHFDFTRNYDEVSMETDMKEEIVLEEKKETKQLSCDICESKFKSIDNLKRHDQRFHITQGTDTTFKCDFCNGKFADKGRLCDHIKNTHKKC